MKLYKYILISVFMFAATCVFAQYNECTATSCSVSDVSNKVSMRSYIKRIALSDYDKEVSQNSKKLVVVYITKPGCVACEKFKRDYFNNIAETYIPKGVKFVEIEFVLEVGANNKKHLDKDSSSFLTAHKDILEQWRALKSATPAIMLVKNGQILDIHTQGKYNRASYDVVAEKIEENIQDSL